MIAGVILILVGAVHLALGWHLSVTELTVVGGLWIVSGLVNIAWSKAARGAIPATAARSATTPAGGSPDLITDPLARAAAVRSNRGAGWRGLITLVCVGAAIYVGAGAFNGEPEGWQIFALVSGFTLGLLTVMGLLMFAFNGVERSAVLPATVVILGYKETGINNSAARPVARFVLTVYAEGCPSYEATITSIVPVLAVPHLAVGARFQALAAGPAKPNNVIVDWNKPLDDGSGSGSAGVAPGVAAGGVGMTSGAPAGAVAGGGSGAVMAGGASGASDASGASRADPAARLRELDALAAQSLISPDEYQAQRARILDGI